MLLEMLLVWKFNDDKQHRHAHGCTTTAVQAKHGVAELQTIDIEQLSYTTIDDPNAHGTVRLCHEKANCLWIYYTSRGGVSMVAVLGASAMVRASTGRMLIEQLETVRVKVAAAVPVLVKLAQR